MNRTPNLQAFEVQTEALSMRTIADAPRLSAASTEAVREIDTVDESGQKRSVYIPNEQPLTVLFDDREIVTLMTLGGAAELLVLGYLINQRLIECAAALDSIVVDWNSGIATVKSRGQVPELPVAVAARALACGQGSVFKRLAHRLESLHLPASGEAQIRPETLRTLLEVMRQHDTIHKHARSVHNCALLQQARLLVSVEDVSRHNALDTICGWMALHGIDGANKVLFTTGRLTGEMVIKGAHSGVPIMVSRNGVSAMGYELAKKFGMALIGRAVNRRFICYVGSERLLAD